MQRAAPVLTIRGRSIPVVLPSVRDPRLHVALVIGSLQVLGQTVLGFELSVAQILVCLGVCACIEAGVALWRERVLLWPASALLTGNSVAFIMRAAGTRHGDWWSLDGIEVFVVACVLSMASKYLLRVGGRHVFNPSNLGLVAAFVLFGSRRANPQDLWWGPLSPGLWLTLAVIVGGGLVVVRRLGMLGLVVGAWVSFAACVGLVAASGHCITARWHYGAVCGEEFWSVMTTSPELLVFLFFMVTDPRTAPENPAYRVAFGAGVGLAAALLAAPMQTEFATKVGVLDGLVIVCAAWPLAAAALGRLGGRVRGGVGRVALPVAAAAALVAAASPARSIALPTAAASTPALSRALPPIAIAEPTVDRTTARALVAIALARAPGAVTSATVLLVRNPKDNQASPQLGVELRTPSARHAYALAPASGGGWAVTADWAVP
ncbi:MAG TPA: hypothetical protein VGQ42_16015 [Candidatus Dormibacteraeota bacterium]|nr:hypothetical protein [Candidatus Dormibacteraeota bacterium]